MLSKTYYHNHIMGISPKDHQIHDFYLTSIAIDLFAMDLLSICLLWIRIRIWAHPQRILIHLSGESKNAIRLPIGDILAELHHF